MKKIVFYACFQYFNGVARLYTFACGNKALDQMVLPCHGGVQS